MSPPVGRPRLASALALLLAACGAGPSEESEDDEPLPPVCATLCDPSGLSACTDEDHETCTSACRGIFLNLGEACARCLEAGSAPMSERCANDGAGPCRCVLAIVGSTTPCGGICN